MSANDDWEMTSAFECSSPGVDVRPEFQPRIKIKKEIKQEKPPEDELDYMSDAFLCSSPVADIRPRFKPRTKIKKEIKQEKPPEDELDYMSDAFLCSSPVADIKPRFKPRTKIKKEIKQEKPPEDELDYMSDAFLCTSPDADIRPGLNPRNKIKKEIKQESPVSVKHLEKEKRNDGLQTPISADNKGFAMLAKMGFKPGSGLGKSGEGRVEPVPINVKSDREGLGTALVRKEKMESTAKLWKETIKKEFSVNDYRKRIIEEANTKANIKDLSKSQKICYNLDSKEGILEPDQEWFWHEHHKEYTAKKSQMEYSDYLYDDDDEEDEYMDMGLTVQEKLTLLTLYLRKTYFYCIWCATQFNNERELEQECPGPTRDHHS